MTAPKVVSADVTPYASADTNSVTHYARDEDFQPICRGGREGDLMSFFFDKVTCPECNSIRVR